MPSPNQTGGPLVDTGPTAGEVRSRNQNGQWRKKRSDAGQPRDGSNQQQAEQPEQQAEQPQQDQQQG